MQESMLDVIRNTMLNEATEQEKNLQPITRTFKRFFKSKLGPYLKKVTCE